MMAEKGSMHATHKEHSKLNAGASRVNSTSATLPGSRSYAAVLASAPLIAT